MRIAVIVLVAALLVARPVGHAPEPARLQGPADSVAVAVQRVGFAVAEVRSGLELLRRAAGNDGDDVVLERSAQLSSKCAALTATVEAQGRALCRHCLEPARQEPIDAYRAYLPSLAGAGRHCAATIAQLKQGAAADAARRLRRQAVPIGEQLVAALIPYEQRLGAVRVAFGWAPPPVPGRPGG